MGPLPHASVDRRGGRHIIGSVAHSSPSAGSPRASSTLDTLLILSRTLTGAKQGGLLAETLELLLTGIGCSRGAAYTAGPDGLELIGERGLPAKLRAPLARLPLGGDAWFAAQRAAQTRKLVADRSVGAAEGCPLDRTALALARWGQVVACPIVSGRDVYGVLVFAWPADEEPCYQGLAVIEIACNMLAIHMARRSHEHRQAGSRGGDARTFRMAALGIVASGLAEELDTQLAEIGRRLDNPQRISSALRARAAGASDPGEALRPARETTARFLSAIRPSTPESVDLAAVVADVVALTSPHLNRRRIAVQLKTAGEHLVVGRRSELTQLFVQIVLRMVGALDEVDDVGSDRGALIPRAFALELRRQGGHHVVRLSDAGDDGTGARASFFEIAGHVAAPGIDLALAREIVIAHEGHIEVGPASGHAGMQCTVVLPAAGDGADRRAAQSDLAYGAQSPHSDQPRAVLLWIDADDLLLEIMTQSLHEMDVRVVRNAAEATQFLAFGATPDLILCNVRLPDRPGHALHAEVARQTPRLAKRFVFVSDGVLTPEIAGYLIASGRPTLVRPIDIHHVRVLVTSDPAAPGPAAATAPTLATLATPATQRADPRHAATLPAFPASRPPQQRAGASDAPRRPPPRACAIRSSPPSRAPPRRRSGARARSEGAPSSRCSASAASPRSRRSP